MRPGIGLLFVGLVLLAANAHAASVSGTVYDGLTLVVLPNTIITITTTPLQTKLATDGTYTFNVDPGTYTLRAEYREQGNLLQSANQNIVVNENGNYTIDLILLPDLEDLPDDPLPGDEPVPSILDQLAQGPLLWLGILGIILVAVGFSVQNVRRNNYKHSPMTNHEGGMETIAPHVGHTPIKEEEDVHLDKYALAILHHLKRGGNRTTQKDLRGVMNIGEAKVSLVVSELESYGFLKKIKRGRGNILILTEKGNAHLEKGSTSLTPEQTNGEPSPSTPDA